MTSKTREIIMKIRAVKNTHPPLSLLCLFVMTSLSCGAKEHKLEKDDVIRLVVFQEDDLTTEATIGKSGNVSFPLIGNVELAGKSLKEAEVEIKALYEKDYLRNAQVNLSIRKHAEKWVNVGGEVRRSGRIQYPEEDSLDLRSAIAQAGDLTDEADSGRIKVRRGNGKTETYRLSQTSGVTLRHGDFVIVEREAQSQATVTVSGSVNRPGLVKYPKKGRLDIVAAIAQAGGFGRLAHKREVKVRRGKTIIAVSLRDIERNKAPMFYLQAGDTVIVRESKI